MLNIDDLLCNSVNKIVKNTDSNDRIISLVPTKKEYKHLSDDKNINNKQTIDYTENIKSYKRYAMSQHGISAGDKTKPNQGC